MYIPISLVISFFVPNEKLKLHNIIKKNNRYYEIFYFIFLLKFHCKQI